MPVNYDELQPFDWVDPRMEWPWRAVRHCMPAAPPTGLTIRPEHLSFVTNIVTFRIMCELIALRLETELRRPIVLVIHPERCVFVYQEFA